MIIHFIHNYANANKKGSTTPFARTLQEIGGLHTDETQPLGKSIKDNKIYVTIPLWMKTHGL